MADNSSGSYWTGSSHSECGCAYWQDSAGLHFTPCVAHQPKLQPVCAHGSLARQCRVCELEAEVKELTAERDAATAALHEGCPHNGNCACAIGSRHFWHEAFCQERDKRPRCNYDHRARVLLALVKAKLDEERWVSCDNDDPLEDEIEAYLALVAGAGGTQNPAE